MPEAYDWMSPKNYGLLEVWNKHLLVQGIVV